MARRRSPTSPGQQQTSDWHAHAPPGLGRELALATAVCVLAIAVGAAAEIVLGFDDLSLVFLTAVIIVSVRSRLGVAVYASTLCFLAYNFFFLEPRYTFYISAREGLATVALFLVSALACARLASRLRDQVRLREAARAQAEALEQLGRRLAASDSDDAAIGAAVATLRNVLLQEVVVLRPDADGELVESAGGVAGSRFDPGSREAAHRCWSEAVGRSEEGVERDLAWYCLPLRTADANLGVVAVRMSAAQPVFPPELDRLVNAMVRDLAQAMARLSLARQLGTSRLQAESERLRAALLSSVSHDLRSPLSTIIGCAESLVVLRHQLSAEDQVQMAQDILGEGQRLDRYIQNLLDMTRLGQGVPAPDRDWIGVDDLVAAALRRIARAHPSRRLSVEIEQPAPLLHVNAPLLEQAIFNALDNAARYSPADTAITVRARAAANDVVVEVSDAGPGIPEAERERVFDMFHRVTHGDRDPGGSGLGLAICRGILAAHGGHVGIVGGESGGTCVRMRLPLEPPPESGSMDE